MTDTPDTLPVPDQEVPTFAGAGLITPGDPDGTFDPDADDDGLAGPLDVVQAEVERAWKVLLADFPEESVSDLLLSCEIDPNVGNAVLLAKEHLEAASKLFAGKARFYLHEDPNGSIYIVRGLKPSEFKTSFLRLYYNDPKLLDNEAEHAAYLDAVLKSCMCYPSFAECDWDCTDPDKPHAPMPLTKMQLVNTFFLYEGPDAPVKRLAFETKDVADAGAHVEKKRRATTGGL